MQEYVTQPKRKPGAFRTSLIATVFAAGALLAGGAQAADLTIVSWGGSYQDAQSKALFQPVAKAMGLKIAEDSYGGISDVRLKVKAGAVNWDIIDSGAASASRGAVEGLFEPLDYDMIDVSNFVPGTYIPHCVGTITFSTVAAWNTETYGQNGPQNWAEFWDTKKFPGKRSYRNKVSGALEPAMMADGVPPEKVYEELAKPDGIERAINKIRELKPHIAVWWASGAQHAQLMKDGEVDMTTGWNGRFDVAIKDGAKAAYTYNQALLDYDCFAIPKGAPNKDLAMKFIAEMSKAEYQADMPKYITYGPTNKSAYDTGKIDPAVATMLPSHPENAKLQLVANLDWYAEFEQKASAAYQDMLTE